MYVPVLDTENFHLSNNSKPCWINQGHQPHRVLGFQYFSYMQTWLFACCKPLFLKSTTLSLTVNRYYQSGKTAVYWAVCLAIYYAGSRQSGDASTNRLYLNSCLSTAWMVVLHVFSSVCTCIHVCACVCILRPTSAQLTQLMGGSRGWWVRLGVVFGVMMSGVKSEYRDRAVVCRMSAMKVLFHLTLSAWSFASCVMWHFYSAYLDYSHRRKFHLKTKCGVRSKAVPVTSNSTYFLHQSTTRKHRPLAWTNRSLAKRVPFNSI